MSSMSNGDLGTGSSLVWPAKRNIEPIDNQKQRYSQYDEKHALRCL